MHIDYKSHRVGKETINVRNETGFSVFFFFKPLFIHQVKMTNCLVKDT